MSADTPLKRYSAMDLGITDRGLNVVPQAAPSGAERAAAMYLYSGITSGPQPGGGGTDIIYVRAMAQCHTNASRSVVNR